MASYITSDLHFYHKNILKYNPETRQYKSLEEMNEAIISDIQSKVLETDVFYHLGDFSFGSAAETRKLIDRLPGTKIFIRGNHDKALAEAIGTGIDRVVLKDYDEVRVNGHKSKVVMFHFPLLVWNKSHHGSVHLHGHSHGSLNHLNKDIRRTDVGWDSLGSVKLLADVVDTTAKKGIVVLDHHDGQRD